jgi:hypothetical protein
MRFDDILAVAADQKEAATIHNDKPASVRKA